MEANCSRGQCQATWLIRVVAGPRAVKCVLFLLCEAKATEAGNDTPRSMARAAGSQKRPPKVTSNGNNSPSPRGASEKGAGMWKFFPVLMVIVGVVLGVLLGPSDLDGDSGQLSDSNGKPFVFSATYTCTPYLQLQLYRYMGLLSGSLGPIGDERMRRFFSVCKSLTTTAVRG